MSVVVATDGSALNNPVGAGGWAWVVDQKRWNAGSVAKGSNQVMEMYAIIRALTEIPLNLDIHIQTDSAFCVNMVGPEGKTGWMGSWKRKGWKKADGKVPANLRLVQELDKAIQSRKGRIKFEWVKGHNGHQLNSLADKLCTRASASQHQGTPFPGGPGWVAPTSSPVAAPRSTQSAAQSRPRLNQAARTSSVPTKKVRSRTNKEYVITSFDDGIGSGVIKKTVESTTIYCHSCNGPINQATGECRCSN